VCLLLRAPLRQLTQSADGVVCRKCARRIGKSDKGKFIAGHQSADWFTCTRHGLAGLAEVLERGHRAEPGSVCPVFTVDSGG
jgi:hypothetical protein